MQEPTKIREELFSLTLTEKGKRYLYRFDAIARYLLAVALLISLTGLAYAFLSFRYRLPVEYNVNFTRRAEGYVSVIYTFLELFLFPLQVFFYYRYATQSKASIELSDNEGFNQSFYWLVMNAVLCLITYSFNLLYFLFILLLRFV